MQPLDPNEIAKEISKLSDQIVAFETALREKKTRKENLERELGELRAKIAQNENTIRELDSEIREAQSGSDELTRKLDEFHRQLRDFGR